jgi:glycerol kinase
MNEDSAVSIDVMRVDGGVTANDFAMQLQADILGVPVSRPVVAETTALGAAYAAGLAVGFWSSTEELSQNWRESRRWEPAWSAEERDEGYRRWQQAVERTFGWVDMS